MLRALVACQASANGQRSSNNAPGRRTRNGRARAKRCPEGGANRPANQAAVGQADAALRCGPCGPLKFKRTVSRLESTRDAERYRRSEYNPAHMEREAKSGSDIYDRRSIGVLG